MKKDTIQYSRDGKNRLKIQRTARGYTVSIRERESGKTLAVRRVKGHTNRGAFIAWQAVIAQLAR